MPSSAKDRFTVDFETIWFFTKQPDYQFEQQIEGAVGGLIRSRVGGPDGTPYNKNNPRRSWGMTKHDIATGRVTGKYSDPLHTRPGDPGRRTKRCVWAVNTQPCPEKHYAAYPEDLIAPMISAGCPVGGTVLDPFMGSGTTAKVALDQNKYYIGVEISPEYCAIIERRLRLILRPSAHSTSMIPVANTHPRGLI
jgi:site-specific DNA-methyltransferase (adenine-specific)